MSASHPQPAPVSHGTAVLTIASVATIWGFGFPMTRFALDGGISVGALMSVRFVIAGVVMCLIIRARSVPVTKRGVVDGVWLGLVLAAIFWLQTDGMRFTTTAKSGFITGLYVLFTPLVAVLVGQRVKLTSGLGAVVASYGLYLLVRPAGGWGSHGLGSFFTEMNRGDFETLLCAILCAVHIVMMGAFSRRTDAWLLAGSQVSVCGIVSGGAHPRAARAAWLSKPGATSGAGVDDLPGAVLHGVRVLGTSPGANPAWSRRGCRALLH